MPMCEHRKSEAATHQPSKAEFEENVRIDATPEALGWAITYGSGEQRRNYQDL